MLLTGIREAARTIVPIALAAVMVACGDAAAGGGGSGGQSAGGQSPGGENAGGADGGGQQQGGAGSGGMTTEDFVAGGDRPVNVLLPDGYDPDEPTPLVILLHGYAADSTVQDSYFVMSSVAATQGLVFAAPDGTIDEGDSRFWNATDACCDFYASGVDDSAYLEGLLDEIESKVNIDPNRIYLVGHSNGGYMAYRMACDHADRIAAIAGLAGATFEDQNDCAASEPVSILHIHGTADTDILYDGGVHGSSGVVYPGAIESVERWVAIDGCDATSVPGTPRDIELEIAGDETTVDIYQGCNGTAVELWSIQGGGHVPSLVEDFSGQVIAWLLLQSK
jgi:polyhydroxybutyrate depolymerase